MYLPFVSVLMLEEAWWTVAIVASDGDVMATFLGGRASQSGQPLPSYPPRVLGGVGPVVQAANSSVVSGARAHNSSSQ